MSIAALDAVMETAKPGRFATVGFVEEDGEARIAWGYVDFSGKHWRGVVWDFEAAKQAASIHGFTLNEEIEGVTA